MHTKEVNDEKYLVVCCYKSVPECPDKHLTQKEIDEKLASEKIELVSHGICSACAKVFL
jgi:hypothetical protein